MNYYHNFLVHTISNCTLRWAQKFDVAFVDPEINGPTVLARGPEASICISWYIIIH